jgi:hypothetical protein
LQQALAAHAKHLREMKTRIRERDSYLRQRDALGERNEYLRQRYHLGELNVYKRL